MLVPSRATPLGEAGTTRGAVGADFRSSQDVEEYLVQVARVNRADPVATGRRGGVPLSSGEIERLRREDFEKRRKLRLIQVREQAKTIAIARRQNFIEDIDRKRAQEKERRRKAWEAQQREKIQRCTQEYKTSLAAIGNAHLEAQQHATRTQAEKARKKALHARARIKEDARHKAALLTQRQEKAAQTFFVHKAQEEHRRLVRENISDEHRAKARRNAHAIEKSRQRALASQAAAEAAQAAALRHRDRVIDISATVPNVATRLQDFATTRFHASLTQHAPAQNPPLDNRSHDARDALETSSDADFDNARTTPRDAFEAATVLNRDIQNRVASESHQRAEHEALAAQRGRQALHEVRAVREQQDLQDALEALRKEEISSNSRDVVQKIRNSWQKRAALDDHKRKLQQRIFEQNFVQAAPSPSPSATFASQTSTSARPQPEILHVIPETEQLNQDLLASSTSADDSRVESPNKLSQLPGKTTPPSPIGADEGERLAHHDLRPSKSTDAAGNAAAPAPAAFDQRAHDPFDTSAAADQSVSSIAIPTAPPQHSMTRSSGIQEAENSDSEEEIDEETRALLEASRKARKRGNQSVQAILKMGQSFLEGSATDYTSSTNGNRRSGRADTTTTDDDDDDDDDDDNDVDNSAIRGRPFRVPRNVTSSSSSPTGESSSVSSTDLSLHARAAAAASAAARAAADAAAQHARNQTSSFPTREQLEQSLTRFLLGDDSDVDQDEDDDLDADQNDRVSSVADYLTREHVGLNASFVSSTSSDRSWEPRRAPGERPGALNDLAISVLRDLEARPARSALQASFSVASSEVSSLRQFPLSPSSRPSTAAGLGQSRGPLQDGDIDDLIVHDDAWRDSAALTDWIHQVETALHNQEEEHDNLEPSSASNKGISSSVKDHHSVQAAADAFEPSSASNKGISSSVKEHHSVQAAADASAPAQVSQEANVEDLIVEDDGWKDDERFASFTADLAQYFETSSTPVSQSRGTPRQVPPAQSVNQDDREVLATPEESVASETSTGVQSAQKPTPPNTEARVNRALQTPTMDAKFDDLDARIQSAARAARVPPASSPDVAAHRTPTQKAQDMTTPPNTEARVNRALQTPTMDAKFDDLDARIQSAARAARVPPASSPDVTAHRTPTQKAQDTTTPPDTEARLNRALQSPTMDAKFDDLEARLRSAERAAHAGLESPNDDRDASLLIFEGNETSSHTELDASPARHLKVTVDSPPSTATAAQSSKSSLDSLEQVQRALKTAREELRAAAALRESPNEITFGSLLDPSADINLGLSDFTAPHLEASPPLPATSSEDEKDENAGNIKDDSALAFHEELFGISVTEDLDEESLKSPAPLSSHRPPSLEREKDAGNNKDQNDDHDAKDRAMAPKRDLEENNEKHDSLSSSPPSPKPTKRPSPQAFAVNFASDNTDELLVRMPQSPTRADLERQRRQEEPPTPDLLQEEHESASGAVAFAVDIHPPAESNDARSRAFQERSARRAAEAQERARRKEAANAQRRKSQSPPSQPPPSRTESNTSESARGPARASFGQRVAVDPREQRARTARLFRKLPEVRQREQEEAQRRQAEERRQRVRKMEEERRKVLFRKR